MYDPTIEVYREICELKWLKQLKFPTNFDTVSVKQLTEKEYCKNVDEQYNNMWVWDCETYWDASLAQVFCCAIAKVNNSKNDVMVFEGTDCILQMVNYIEENTQRESSHHRNHIYLWAHNSKGFDSYIALNQKTLKFKNIVKNGSNIL